MNDTRDLRDPQKIGEMLLNVRNSPTGVRYPGVKFSQIADNLHNYPVPNYPQDELLSTITAREYRAELEERAAQGDKYAKSILDKRSL